MSQTHHVTSTGDTVTKTYTDRSRGEDQREWTALRVISTARPGLVPVPLRLTGATLTMTRLPGTPLAGELTAQQLDGLETALRDLWSIPPASLAPVDHPALVARIRADLQHSPTGETTAAGAGPPPEASRAGAVGECWRSGPRQDLLREARQVALDWLDGDEAAELARPANAVIGHGDPNLANYLWDGVRVRIVDFEDAGRSDLAYELGTLVEHLASRGTRWDGFAERFGVDAARFRAARCLWASFWLTMVGPGGPAAERNPPGTGVRQAARVLELIRPGGEATPGGTGRRGC
ncbi:aminoglycoside phosphotransferase [Kribbella flavida DSM 17836]|uniref:Aminoglycoside phosphotransferase n=1 Tax=Kribbella flavida (strain DSM 17836 / JCM 10339 / NBRC 14399) TaxID=479435 RepID=D2PT51_KRIFD|nr:aminoglycoside phosphotransferase family protein [Kribbella flavida]ADB29367.1 aminoglycoside phosphotransferase [Kribbella flavida DSM 17836]